MTTVRRYYIVSAPKSEIVHRAETVLDGDRTFCGRAMWAGWVIGTRRPGTKKCKGCYA